MITFWSRNKTSPRDVSVRLILPIKLERTGCPQYTTNPPHFSARKRRSCSHAVPPSLIMLHLASFHFLTLPPSPFLNLVPLTPSLLLHFHCESVLFISRFPRLFEAPHTLEIFPSRGSDTHPSAYGAEVIPLYETTKLKPMQIKL